jgi:PAS domain S-box-containing protein
MENLFSFLKCFTKESVFVFDSEGHAILLNEHGTANNYSTTQHIQTAKWKEITEFIEKSGKWKGYLDLTRTNAPTKNACCCISLLRIDETARYILSVPENHELFSEEKQLLEKLKRSERNAQALINSSDSAILLLSKDFEVISANDRAKVLGTRLFKSVIKEGDNFVDITPNRFKKTFAKFFNRALEGESGQSYQKLTFANNKDYWFLFKYTPIWENNGAISSVAWTATDVTDEKRSEEYTIKVLQRLNLANSAGEIGIWEFDFNKSVMTFDDQCLNLFDKTIDVKEHLPKWAKLYTVQSRSKILAILGNQSLYGKKNFELELKLENPIGSNEYHKLKGTIKYNNNEPISATGILLDITKTKVAERNLEGSRNQLLQAQRLAKMGDFEYDVNKNKVIWGENNFDLHGITESQMPTLLQYVRHFSIEDRSTFIEAIRKASVSNSTQEVILHFDKHVFNYTIKGIFYRNKLTKIVGTVQDITDNITLQENLEIKEKQIDANRKLISEYSFVNSHKVRAPLSNILGLIQLIKLEHNEELLEMLEKSAEELDHVIHEVNSLLAE